MGCCGERDKLEEGRAEQKWDYINLSDFRSSGAAAPLSYGVLYISLIISVAVYLVDIFTAVNLLAFNKWSGQIKPAISLDISKWIFAGCIILSLVLLVYRWIRAIRCIKSGDVAKSYLDPLAVRLQSIRVGSQGRGWRRFLVFAELTKSKKGADYVALFTYFSFEAWMRICFAEGPRQVINAITLYSVMQLNLIPEGENAPKDGHTAIVQFFVNIEALAEKNNRQAVILSGMLFTLVIWVFSVLSLIISITLYLLFLWHHIPNHDGTLRKFCRRKVTRRLERIVGVKIKQALEKENRQKAQQAAKAGKSASDVKINPTLPDLGDADSKDGGMAGITRQNTQTTLPPYTSRPGTADSSMRNPTLPDINTMPGGRPFLPTRSTTQSSAASYGSNAPLLAEAGPMGYEPEGYEGRPSLDRTMTNNSQFTQRSYSNGPRPSPVPEDFEPMPPIQRTMTAGSQFSQRSLTSGPPRPSTAQSRRTPGPPPLGPNGPFPMGPIQRPGTAMSNASSSSRRGPGPPSGDPLGRRGPFVPPIDTQGRSSPAPPFANGPANSSSTSLLGRGTPGPQPSRTQTPVGGNNGGYVAFNPTNASTPNSAQPQPPRQPYRNMTDPYQQQRPGPDYFNAPSGMNRSGTAPPMQYQSQPQANNNAGYDDSIYDSYASPESTDPTPFRAQTTTPTQYRQPPGGQAWTGNGQRPGPGPAQGQGQNSYAAFRFD